MTSSFDSFHKIVSELIDRIASTQRDSIQQAASLVAEHIAGGGILYLLGSGHSLAVAMEAHDRAGGLAPVDVIYDPFFGRAERLEGYAECLLKRYNIPAGGVVVIISNSGRNALPVEVALHCKANGIRTIAITSLAHSKAVSSRHSSGKRLFEIADIVIDNCGTFGDASLEIEGLPGRACPTSGIAGMFIVESLIAQTIENLIRMGVEPPVLLSANVDEGDAHNKKLYEKYFHRIRGI